MARITITIETENELQEPEGMQGDIESDLDEMLYRRFTEDWDIPLEELTVEIDRDKK